MRAHFPNNPRAPHRAGLRRHCVARFIWRLVKTRCAQTLTSRYPDKAVLLVSTKGDFGCRQQFLCYALSALMRSRASQSSLD